jgi:hypothetical protein
MLPATQMFHCGGRLFFLQIGLFSKVEETHTSLERNPYVLQAVALMTLYPSEN